MINRSIAAFPEMSERPLPLQPSAVRAATSPVRRSRWMAFLCVTLLGYALFGKGWAYLGVPPVYVGEAVLFCGLVAFIRSGKWRDVFGVPAAGCLLLLLVWGSVRVLPDVPSYGATALRDAAIWGYGAFAFVISAYILAEPSRLQTLLRWYGAFVPVFLLGSPLIWLVYRMFGDSITHWPWADVPIILPKGGDALVHFAGILAFWVAGLASPSFFRLALLAFSVVLMGTFDRAGFLSFLVVFTLCAFFQPRDRSLRRLVMMAAGGLFLLAVSNVQFRTWEREREVSFTQIVENLKSVVGFSRAGDLDDTKQWRLEWWNDIYNYTIHGNYFWTGKGFGINLAQEDGITDGEEGSMLRSPHNGHLTILARGGVPGLVLWSLAQLTWVCGMLRVLVRSRRRGERDWQSLFLFLLAYWTAFLINATFDVFLEGPMGGIWFWTIYGIGLAAMRLYRRDPTALQRAIAAHQTSGTRTLGAT